jgi:hypothetical protein
MGTVRDCGGVALARRPIAAFHHSVTNRLKSHVAFAAISWFLGGF